jgi:hypothetical protein
MTRSRPPGLRISKLVCFVLIVGGFFALSSASYADTFGSIASIQGLPEVCTGSSSVGVTCTATGPGGALIGSAFASGVGSLAAGTMGTLVSLVGFQDPLGYNDVTVDANAGLEYYFAMPTSLNGDTVQFSLVVSGTNLQSCTTNGFLCSENVSTQLDLVAADENFVGLGSGSGSVNFGTGVTDLEVSTSISDGNTLLYLQLSSHMVCDVGYTGVCSGSSDFIDPLSITGAEVFDSSGALVSGISVISESGFNPNAGTPIPAPEPPSLLLLGAGLLALIGTAKLKALTA